jgi:hypothetical protein
VFLSVALQKSRQQVQRLRHAPAIPRSAQIQEQAPRGGQQQRCLSLSDLGRPSRPRRQRSPVAPQNRFDCADDSQAAENGLAIEMRVFYARTL